MKFLLASSHKLFHTTLMTQQVKRKSRQAGNGSRITGRGLRVKGYGLRVKDNGSRVHDLEKGSAKIYVQNYSLLSR